MDPSGRGPSGRDPADEGKADLGAAWGSLDDESLLFDEDFIQKILDGEDDLDLPEDLFFDGEDPVEASSDKFPFEPLEETEETEEEQLAEQTLDQFQGQEEKRESLYSQIKGMAVGHKIKLALKGGREARSILLRDANRIIKRLVLRNPRISEDEIVIFAHNKSEESEFLDFIGKRKEWMKSYQVRLALVTNPKTPAPLALRIVSVLLDRDLRRLAKSKSVPNIVSSAAKRLLFKRQGGGG
jgi:hypothetical protein